jgi:hypothetical protein
MNYKNKTEAKKLTGLSYLGMVNNSVKHEKAFSYNEMVYSLYLAPAKMSGYEVCPMRSKECTDLCLNESGHNRIDIKNNINNSRIKKTKLFFEHRQFFMDWMIDEIRTSKKKAEENNFKFSVRLNNTSDISPESFYYKFPDGKIKNILEIFPDVQFYDYTKVPNRTELTKYYKNYDITFSYSGQNMDKCMEMLLNGFRVAMVFKEVPEYFMGYEVVYGDNYDMRYYDPKNVIIGLKYKKTRKKLDSNVSFVIQ